MRSQCRWLFGAFIAVAMSGAWATGTRINFSGAVVESTCAFDGARAGALQSVSSEAAPSHQRCGQTAVAAGRSFTRHVLTVDAAMAAQDRLLGYFASRASRLADGHTAARLVVRTYD